MITPSHPVKSPRQRLLLERLAVLVILCLVGCAASCAPVNDPSLAAVQWALKNGERDPKAADKALEDNLYKVKDKRVIPLLLDYLKEAKHRRPVYTNVMGRAAFYLDEVTGIESRINTTFAGALYHTEEDLKEDIRQWQNWWDANKDYVFWDEQAEALRVKPH